MQTVADEKDFGALLGVAIYDLVNAVQLSREDRKVFGRKVLGQDCFQDTAIRLGDALPALNGLLG